MEKQDLVKDVKTQMSVKADPPTNKKQKKKASKKRERINEGNDDSEDIKEYKRNRKDPVSDLFHHISKQDKVIIKEYVRANGHPETGKYLTVQMFANFLRSIDSVRQQMATYLPHAKHGHPTKKQASELLGLFGFEYVKTGSDTYAARAKKPETKIHRSMAVPFIELCYGSDKVAFASHDETQDRVVSYPAKSWVPIVQPGEFNFCVYHLY